MLTRKAVAKDMENKLKATLHDLKVSQSLCEKLIQERDESELEIQEIIKKNSLLKAELAELHMKYICSEDKCKALQDVVDSFQQCSSDHEIALSRIAELECSLMEVQEDNPKRQCNTPSSLHDELVECGQLSGSVNFKKINFSSHKKLKKYLRLSKFIKRTQSIVRKSSLKNVIQLEKDKKNLVQELDKYHRDLEYYKILYDVETNELKEKIDSLSHMLNDVNQKYSAAQIQINEHIQQADDLIKLSTENMSFESLTNNYFI
ncbi:uncharacterized protein LOC123692598 [Colias croceus]|uniref:uncharacterized protein LOC123692598 n=1 Tax=Colias crocea TaxID=72248 RepID=UPI001E27FD3A|nr:uncharacterized protein LOC123692598 [Colias croceus]